MPDWSYSAVNFFNIKVLLKGGKIVLDLSVKSTDIYQYLDSSSCHPYHYKKVSLKGNFWTLIESILKMSFLIRNVMNWDTGYMNKDIVEG